MCVSEDSNGYVMRLKEGDEVAENKVEELYGHKMMDYPGPHPDPRDNPHLRLHLRTKKTLWKIL
ncbi:hypothetical protein YC2023_101708 [Brassica napus]